jgi:hypothetical protein
MRTCLENKVDDYYDTLTSHVRQQIQDMFQHRSSRYNFLDLSKTMPSNECIYVIEFARLSYICMFSC